MKMTKNKITFPNQNKPEFINELRAGVQNYFDENHISKFGDRRIIVKATVMFAVYFVPYIVLLTGIIESVPLVIVFWAIMGFGMAGVGMTLMHDANHRSFSKNQTINKWLGRSIYLLGGFPPNWRHQHNTLHHGFTNIEGHDEDISPVGLLRFSPHKPLKKIHRYQHLYAWALYGLMTVFWSTTKDFKQFARYKKEGAVLSKSKTNNQLMLDLILSKIVYWFIFLIVPLVFIPVAWYWIVLSFFVMHYVCGFVLTAIFQTAHVVPSSEFPLPNDQGRVENNWAIHQLLNTSDYSPKSKVFSWMIGGLNYQVEHHLFPTISHVHYKSLSKLVRETADKYHLPYYVQPTFFAALKSHYQMLKMMGR